MTRLLRGFVVLLVAVVLIMQFGRSGVSADTELPWHFDGWKHRTVFGFDSLTREVQDLVKRGLLYAQLNVQTHDREMANGSDVRVVDESGTELRTWTGVRAENGIRRIYCRPGKAKRMIVYYGCSEPGPKPSALLPGSPSALTGLSAGYYYSPGILFQTTEAIAKFTSGSEPQLNAQVEMVSLRKSPFGLKDIPIVSVFEGYILAHVDGEYFFGTDSHGPSFVEINGKSIAEWPGNHWKQGSYSHGGKIILKRGVHRFRYFNQRLGGGFLADAGWAAPGYPDSFQIPRDRYVRYAPMTPLFAQDAPGRQVSAFELIERDWVSLNEGAAMMHIETHSFGSGSEETQWELTVTEGTPEGYEFMLPYRAKGSRAEFFMAQNCAWRLTATTPGSLPVTRDFAPKMPRRSLVLPFYIESGVDTLPHTIFRDRPFGIMVVAPNRTSFTPVLDFAVSLQTPTGSPVTKNWRKEMQVGRHVVLDMVLDPRVPGFLSLPGFPFTEKPSRSGDSSFYDSTLGIRVDVNGIVVSRHSVSMLGHSDPLPEGMSFDRRGYMDHNGKKLLLISELEDDSELRRWAPIKSITRLTGKYSSFLLVGDGYSKGEGLLSRAAAKLAAAGLTATTTPTAELPFPAYANAARAFQVIEKKQYECAVLSFGYEDAFRRTPPRVLETIVQAFVNRSRGRGVKRTVVLLPPEVVGYGSIISEYRTTLSAVVSRLQLDVIDLQPMLAGAFQRDGYTTRDADPETLDSAASELQKILAN